jgi:putative transposase
MSRPIRVEIEDGWYHVISRGLERRDIFRDDSDRHDFLDRLFGLTESHALLVHAYCLMKNHFHLQVQTRQANLKEAMQRLRGSLQFAASPRGAALPGTPSRDFGGRGRLDLRSEPLYSPQPGPIGIARSGQTTAEIRRGIEVPAEEAVVRQRLELLRAYPWSSYRAYAGYLKGPPLLQKAAVLGCFDGRSLQQQRKTFRDYTESAIREGAEGDGLLERKAGKAARGQISTCDSAEKVLGSYC